METLRTKMNLGQTEIRARNSDVLKLNCIENVGILLLPELL